MLKSGLICRQLLIDGLLGHRCLLLTTPRWYADLLCPPLLCHSAEPSPSHSRFSPPRLGRQWCFSNVLIGKYLALAESCPDWITGTVSTSPMILECLLMKTTMPIASNSRCEMHSRCHRGDLGSEGQQQREAWAANDLPETIPVIWGPHMPMVRSFCVLRIHPYFKLHPTDMDINNACVLDDYKQAAFSYMLTAKNTALTSIPIL